MGLKMLVSWLGVVVLLGVPVAAEAEDSADEARVQFEQGKAFFNEGKYEQAAIALERAYELRPGYKILYYLGLAESEQGNYSRALNAYTRYLVDGAEQDDPARVQEVRAEIEKLRAMVGRIHIDCPIDGAKVQLDSETQGITPLPSPVFADVGKHEIVVKQGQRELLREVVRIAGGQEVTLKVETGATTSAPMEAATEPQPVPPPEKTPRTEEDKSGRRVWTWVALGIGGAAGIGAVVTGVMALKLDEKLWTECETGTCHSYQYDGDFEDDKWSLKTLGITTDILIGVAAAGAVTATILFFVEPNIGSEKRVAASPVVFGDGGGLVVTGRF